MSNIGIRPISRPEAADSSRREQSLARLVFAGKVAGAVIVLGSLFCLSVLAGAGLGSLASKGLGIERPCIASTAQGDTLGAGGPLEPLDGASGNGPESHEADDLKQFTYTVSSNDNIFTALQCFGVPRELILSWIEISKDKYDLAKIKPGQVLTLYVTPDRDFSRLELDLDKEQTLVISREDGEYLAAVESFEVIDGDEAPAVDTSVPRPAWTDPETGWNYYRGQVTSSFYESAVHAGMTPSKVMALTRVFFNVKFDRDVKPGARFSVITGKGKTAGEEGPVLAAMIEVGGKAKYIFRWGDKNSSYFDEKGVGGTSGKKMICPVRYKRISSGYTHRRKHPVLGIYRPHYGVDYAAPTGTPVKAAADGVVESAGWRGDYGRAVVIRHGGGMKTMYGHLNGYGKGIKSGVRVRQGQVIGYVGASGLASGPHLDYRVYKNGKPVNPLRVTSTPGPSVGNRAAFNRNKDHLTTELKRPLPQGPVEPVVP